jgi:glycosyltransferase involved in cell wall biosynthesis
MKILWLASWYPNPLEPSNGDFIQRHAEAVAEVIPIDVIHVLQTGRCVPVAKEIAITNKKDNLTEYIYAFEYKPSGNAITDTLRYNISYFRFYKKILQQYFTTRGKPDLIHVHVPVKAGLIALGLLKKYRIPYIVSEQSSHYEISSPDYFFKRNFYFRYNTKRIFKHAAAVTNVSETIGKKLRSIFKIKNYYTIHNLVDTSLFYYKPKQQTNKLRFIHVSAMGEQKNPVGIIMALATLAVSYKDWECVFCGPFTEELRSLVKEKNLEAYIQFRGEITYKQVAVEMQAADIFILFSNHENFPCVVIEALCCGLPVVSSNAGGINEAVNEKNGLLVNTENVEALTQALLQTAMHINKYSRQKIASDATALYNKKIIAEQFVGLYKKIHHLQHAASDAVF